jgi:drug/metabolite transporter (DMT)-like permease
MRLRADLTLLLVAILWGTAFAAQRIAAQLSSVYFFNGVRFLVAALILLPFLIRAKPIPGQWRWMLLAGTILFAASALQQAGLLRTTAGNAGFITSLYVVFVPFVVLLGWREMPRARALAAALVAAGGAYLLSTTGRYELRVGDTLELVGAVFWALHVVLLGKFASFYESVSFSAGQLLVGSVLNLLTGALIEKPVWPPPVPLIGAMLYTAVASLALGYTLQIWGQKRTPPTDAAIILSLESVFAALTGSLILSERLSPVQLAGCLLILGAILLSQIRGGGKIEQL